MTLEAPLQPACPARILVVEDDPSIALGLKLNLGAEGYEVGVADDGSLGLERITSERWDVVILDVMLPKLNGYEVVTRMRQGGDETPVLMLSAKSTEADKVMGLELGAEDYITKPFGIGELLARIKVALRRRPKAPPPQQPAHTPAPDAPASEEPREGALYRFSDVEVDTRTREVRRAGQPVDMTVTEFDILETLVKSGGSVMSRRAIFERVWGPNHHGTPRTIDNFVAQLRQKLEPDAERAKHIVTVRGIGYRFVADPKR
jgi:two-component system, OmpR family, alkaline phosphatase synthesis response regulator PhoP